MVDAYWQHLGEPKPEIPHAELASGKCSTGYVDVPRLLRYPRVTEIIGKHLGHKVSLELKEKGIDRVDWVVSSAYSAITLGHEVAKYLGAIFLNTEKDPKDDKKQLWRRQTIPAGSNVLDIEELITTTQTSDAVRTAVIEGNSEGVNFLNMIGTFVWRPEKLVQPEAREIIFLISTEIQNFDPPVCPHCAVNSKRYKPKTHWAELTGKK
ncbi:MAG: hypothetical protein ABII07_01510 [Patescibacteria group bacterium]